MDRLTELFDLELPADRSNLLTVLVEGSGRYTELRETYNHGRMTKHLKAFISAC